MATYSLATSNAVRLFSDNGSSGVLGGSFISIGTLTVSGNYTTGGDALTSTFKKTPIKASKKPIYLSVTDGNGVVTFVYDFANNKLKCYTASATEKGNGTNFATSGTLDYIAIFQKK